MDRLDPIEPTEKDAPLRYDIRLLGRILGDTVRDGLARMSAECKGSSMRVKRVILMAEPPSVDGHEITDKGYINQRATLERRKAMVDKLYAGGDGVIDIP